MDAQITTAPAVETVAEDQETVVVVGTPDVEVEVEVPAEDQEKPVKAEKKPKHNTIGLARKAVPNGSKVFALPVGESDAGVVSFRVFTFKGEGTDAKVSEVTKVLRGTDGTDLPTRGRPRNEVVLRAKATGRHGAVKALGDQIAHALYGDEGRITVQAM